VGGVILAKRITAMLADAITPEDGILMRDTVTESTFGMPTETPSA
jgi:hypothetical protein